MSNQGDKDLSEPSQVPDGQKRRITWSNKVFQDTVNDKLEMAICKRSKLIALLKKIEECEDYIIERHMNELMQVTNEYELITYELKCLFEQDNYGDFKEEAEQTVSQAHSMIKKAKTNQSDRRSEAPSRRSRSHSHHSRRSSSSTSSYTRLNALAEAAAARESAEYERVMTRKEHDCRQRELEHAKEMAILIADKKVAIANAKLKAIEEALQEEELGERVNIPEIPEMGVEERTDDWVNSVVSQENALPGTNPSPFVNVPYDPTVPHNPTTNLGGTVPATSVPYDSLVPHDPTTNLGIVPVKSVLHDPLVSHGTTTNIGSTVPLWSVSNSSYRTPSQAFISQFSQIGDATGSQLIELLMSANQQVAAGLARQNLPKCHPDIFSGDATLFHPWKQAFKAMIKDTSVTAEQEINYLRSFTCGEVQRVVDNFRKRNHNDPTSLLQNLWKELETRFGSPAVITNALLEHLHSSSNFHEKDYAKLQEFADLCADVDSQIDNLPGLACLHYPGAIRPIIEKLPVSLRTKWEKELLNMRKVTMMHIQALIFSLG
ncbi:Hypothetical predicted protein [Paramuricea clavata]|uniref:Uncharacterized protein n=1 Tax=Paramuricea clavata TaxID=317549 RepID=A0A6S7KBA0_PARCT|nr:Hypothetical predicted protein [Paramuricea clavata]